MSCPIFWNKAEKLRYRASREPKWHSLFPSRFPHPPGPTWKLPWALAVEDRETGITGPRISPWNCTFPFARRHSPRGVLSTGTRLAAAVGQIPCRSCLANVASWKWLPRQGSAVSGTAVSRARAGEQAKAGASALNIGSWLRCANCIIHKRRLSRRIVDSLINIL